MPPAPDLLAASSWLDELLAAPPPAEPAPSPAPAAFELWTAWLHNDNVTIALCCDGVQRRAIRAPTRNARQPRGLRFAPDGSAFAAILPGKGLRVWSLQGERLFSFKFETEFDSMQWAPTGDACSLSAWGTGDGTLVRFRGQGVGATPSFTILGAPMHSWSPCGRWLSVAMSPSDESLADESFDLVRDYDSGPDEIVSAASGSYLPQPRTRDCGAILSWAATGAFCYCSGWSIEDPLYISSMSHGWQAGESGPRFGGPGTVGAALSPQGTFLAVARRGRRAVVLEVWRRLSSSAGRRGKNEVLSKPLAAAVLVASYDFALSAIDELVAPSLQWAPCETRLALEGVFIDPDLDDDHGGPNPPGFLCVLPTLTVGPARAPAPRLLQAPPGLTWLHSASLQWTPDASRLAGVLNWCHDRQVCIWDRDGGLLHHFRGPSGGGFPAFCWLPAGSGRDPPSASEATEKDADAT